MRAGIRPAASSARSSAYASRPTADAWASSPMSASSSGTHMSSNCFVPRLRQRLSSTGKIQPLRRSGLYLVNCHPAIWLSITGGTDNEFGAGGPEWKTATIQPIVALAGFDVR